jgi:transcriptional regulator with XRE-family HTH domain
MVAADVLTGHSRGLGATLRGLRQRAGLTGARLGARCAMSQSKISKIETGKIIPSVLDVERILQALNAPPDVLAQVTELAERAHTEFQDVRSLLRKGLDKKQSELSSLEHATTDFRFFLPAMIAGLISTPEYISASLAHIRGDTTKAIAKKIERQAVLYDSGKAFSFVLTESAVRWPVCSPPVMARQLDRLTELSRLANIRLGIIPVAVTAQRGPLNTFTVYDDRLVTAETFSGAVIMRDPLDVALHIELFGRFAGTALFADAARERLEIWASLFRSVNLCEYGNEPGSGTCAFPTVVPVADLSGTGLIADDLYLMAHNDATGKPFVQPRALGLGIGAGLLAELMLLGAVTVGHGGVISVPGRILVPDPVAGQLLNLMCREQERHPVREWLVFCARSAADDVARRLERSGYLATASTWAPWQKKRWLPVDINAAFAPLVRVRAALDATRPPTARGAVLAGLASACGLGFRLSQYSVPTRPRSVDETVGYLNYGLRELVAQTQAAVDNAVLSHRA